jgi:hypothetical protein
MAMIDEENCPECLVEWIQAIIMEVEMNEKGFIYHCPQCDAYFTPEELEEIYNGGENGAQ